MTATTSSASTAIILAEPVFTGQEQLALAGFLAPGGRKDDFEASGVDFSARGRIFDRQLEEITAVWRGERGIGPAPRPGGRPGLLIGGRTTVPGVYTAGDMCRTPAVPHPAAQVIMAAALGARAAVAIDQELLFTDAYSTTRQASRQAAAATRLRR
jgi:NADPH-dependent glutamate synthase beta subunit-like oxidoreductase